MEKENPQTDVIATLVEQEGLERVDLSQIGAIDPEILSIVPEDIAIKFKAIPFGKEADTILVAMANPFDLFAEDAIRAVTNSRLRICFSPKQEIDEWLAKHYLQSSISDYTVGHAEPDEKDLQDDVLKINALGEESDDAPAIKYVNQIFVNAIQERASDIHIEPQEKELKVRFRIDGVLRDVATAPRSFHSRLISRLKILSSFGSAINGHLVNRARRRGRIFHRIHICGVGIRCTNYPRDVFVRCRFRYALPVASATFGHQSSQRSDSHWPQHHCLGTVEVSECVNQSICDAPFTLC